jgi:hypothetical protein
MTVAEAIAKWGYPKGSAKRLEQVCRTAPKRFVRKGQVTIPEGCDPLYLPDGRYKRTGAVYAQLLNACVRRQEAVPESLRLTAAETEEYLRQLEKAGLIRLFDPKRNTTLRYLPTPAGEEHNSGINRTKRLLEAIKPILPSIQLSVAKEA